MSTVKTLKEEYPGMHGFRIETLLTYPEFIALEALQAFPNLIRKVGKEKLCDLAILTLEVGKFKEPAVLQFYNWIKRNHGFSDQEIEAAQKVARGQIRLEEEVC